MFDGKWKCQTEFTKFESSKEFPQISKTNFLYHRQVHSHIKHSQLYDQTILRFCEKSIKMLALIKMGWLSGCCVCQRIHQEESAKRVTLRSQRLILFFSSFKVTKAEVYLQRWGDCKKYGPFYGEKKFISIEKKGNG